MRRRIWLRATALALAVAGVIAGLTVYFSSESTPPCLVSGAATWHPPTDGKTHRYAVVFPDRAACFFALDDQQKLVGALRLPAARGISSAAPLRRDIALRAASGPYTLDVRTGRLTKGGLAPFASDTLTATDPEHGAMYVTQRGLLGFRVVDLRTGATSYVVHFKGFTWKLWVLDAPNRTLHVFDVSALPNGAPRRVDDVLLDRTMTQVGSLTHSADGRFLYVGDSGAVIDTQTQKSVAELDALQKSNVVLEVDWVDGRPVFPGFPR